MKWSESLSVGVDMIDRQHQSLINAVNDLFDACGKGQGRQRIAETMQFLEDYVHTHFRDEEELQKRQGYPGLPAHRELHREFVETFLKYKTELQAQGPTIGLVAKFNRFVSEWLIYHISREDKKIGEYINSRKSAGTT